MIEAPEAGPAPEALAAVRIGPKAEIAHSLGLDVLYWTREYLLQPDGPNAGKPWLFTDEQIEFVMRWYAVDRQGRFVYRYGMLRRMKGWGKDPFAAALCCVECFGPCRFGGWRDGAPIVVDNEAAWVQTAAVAKDQTRNTMTLFPSMISPKAIDEYRIDIGKEIIYAHDGKRRIEAVTSSPAALEGGRATFVLKNETHHWLPVGDGHLMAKVIARNVAKSRDAAARVLAISNAHEPGEQSDAERDWEAWEKLEQSGRAETGGILYDSLEAPEGIDLEDDEQLAAGITAARGDSVWLDVPRLIAEIRDPRTDAASARRFYLNQLCADEDKPFDRDGFIALTRLDYRPAPGSLIVCGFDGSINRDHTALVGMEVETAHQFVIGYWEPQELPNGERQIPRAEVDQTIADTFDRWDVWRLNADPSKWGPWFATWEEKYGDERIVKWSPMLLRRMAYALATYRTEIQGAAFTHDGDPRLIAAVTNARKRRLHMLDDNGEPLCIVQKVRPDSPLKIDALIAAVLANEARIEAIAAGATNSGEVGVLWA